MRRYSAGATPTWVPKWWRSSAAEPNPAREATASWQRTRPVASTSGAYRAGHPAAPAQQAYPTAHATQQHTPAHDVQDRPSYPAAS